MLLPQEYESARKAKRAQVTGFGGEVVTFDDGQNNFNVTWAKCATRWSQVVGVWTYKNDTTKDNATWIDIYRDVCDIAKLPYANGTQLNTPEYLTALNTAIQTNANALQNEVQALSDTILSSLAAAYSCGSYPSLSASDELRRLLQVRNNYWTYVITGTIVLTSINTGLYYSAYPNNTAWQIAESGLTTALQFLAVGVLGWVAQHPRVQNADRQIVAGTTSAARRTTSTVARVGANVAGVVQSASDQALSSLAGSNQNLLQMGIGSSSNPGEQPVGGGSFVDPNGNGAGSSSGVAGTEDTMCLREIVVDGAIARVSETLAQGVGVSPLDQVQSNIAGQNPPGSCHR